MVRRRHRGEITIFSTSFLDLLFCGLAAVVLLWVLLEEPVEARKPLDYTFVTFRQKGSASSGVWHFEELDADGNKYNKYDANPVKTKANVTKYLDAKGVGLSETEGSKDGFAGSLTLSVKPDAQRCVVKLKFDDCTASEFHVLHLTVESLRSRTVHSMLFDATKGAAAAVPAAALPRESKDVGNLFPEFADGSQLEFQLEIEAGKADIFIVDPAGKLVPWREVANK